MIVKLERILAIVNQNKVPQTMRAATKMNQQQQNHESTSTEPPLWNRTMTQHQQNHHHGGSVYVDSWFCCCTFSPFDTLVVFLKNALKKKYEEQSEGEIAKSPSIQRVKRAV